MSFTPFRDTDSHSAFRHHLETVMAEIKNLENSYVLRTSATELEQFYLDKAHVEPIRLHTDGMCIEDQRSVQVDAKRDPRRTFMPGDNRPYHIPGTQVTIAIPFDGDPTLWKIRPSTYSLSGYPEIDLRGNLMLLMHRFADDTADSANLKSEMGVTTRSGNNVRARAGSYTLLNSYGTRLGLIG